MFTPNIRIELDNTATNLKIYENSIASPNGWGITDYCGNTGQPPLIPSLITGLSLVIKNSYLNIAVQTINIPVSTLIGADLSEILLLDVPFTHGFGIFTFDLVYTLPSCTVNTTTQLAYLLPDTTEFTYINDQGGVSPYNPLLKRNAEISVCMNGNKCDSININEITEFTSTNVLGWVKNPGIPDGAPVFNGGTAQKVKKLYIDVYDDKNVLVDTITIVEIEYLNSNGSVSNIITNNFSNPYTGPFTISNSWNHPDGYYKFVYKIDLRRTHQPDYTLTYNTVEQFFFCNTAACVDKLWLKYISTCDCNKKNYKQLENTILDVQLLLDGVKTSIVCMNKDDATNIVNTLNKICKLTTSNCGCK